MGSNTQGGFQELTKIQISDIVEKTHIRADIVRAIIQKDFGQIHAVKARGFISILEREYNLDLDEWIHEYMDFKRDESSASADQGYFVVANQSDDEQKSQAKSWGVSILAIAIVVIVGYGLTTLSTSMAPAADSNTDIPMFEMNQTMELNESNATNDNNESKIIAGENNGTENNASSLIDQNISSSSSVQDGTVTPGKKIWIGLRNVSDKSFKSINGLEPFVLNGQKEYLLQAGHGEFTIQFNGKVYKPQTMHFTRVYICNGVVKEVSASEFDQMEKKAKSATSIRE
jgi:hypothetical protein